MISVVVTYEKSDGAEIEWRGEFEINELNSLWSYFTHGCEDGTFQYYENGEEID